MVVARGGDPRDNDAEYLYRCAATIAGQQTEHQTNTKRTPTEPLELFCCELSSKDMTLLYSIFDSTATPVYTVHSSLTDTEEWSPTEEDIQYRIGGIFLTGCLGNNIGQTGI